jgi:ABC-type transport system involved in multi-copper enzyme maturation permease subunit
VSFITIARRELEERRIVLIAAIAFALLPVLLAIVPLQGTPSERILVAGRVLSIGFTISVALALGVTLIGRDLSSGRLSFYFERPVHASAIWLGKLAAALLLVTGAFAITYLPVVFVQGPSDGDGRLLAGVVIASAVAILLIAHAVSTITRSHSWLIALDILAMAVTVVAGYSLVVPLLKHGASTLAIAILCGICVGGLFSVAVAGVWQLSRGRADRKQSHSAFSTALWSAVACVVLVATGIVLWVFTRGPESMTFDHGTVAANRPELVIATGELRGRLASGFRSAFILNSRTGEWQRAPVDLTWWSLDFSADGSTVIWMTPVHELNWELARWFRWTLSNQTPFELYVAKMDDLSKRRLLAETSGFIQAEVSPKGDTVATLSENGLIAIYDSTSGKLRASAKLALGPGRSIRLMQLKGGMFVVATTSTGGYVEALNTLTVIGLDMKTAALSTPRVSNYSGVGLQAYPSRDMARIEVMNERRVATATTPAVTEWSSIDPTTGTVSIAGNAEEIGRIQGVGFRLHDGRIIEADASSLALHIEGRPIARQPFKGRPWVICEIAPAMLVVSVRSSEGFSELETVDVNRQTVIQSAPGLTWQFPFDPVTKTALVTDREGHLIRWNPLTGARTPFTWQ